MGSGFVMLNKIITLMIPDAANEAIKYPAGSPPNAGSTAWKPSKSDKTQIVCRIVRSATAEILRPLILPIFCNLKTPCESKAVIGAEVRENASDITIPQKRPAGRK